MKLDRKNVLRALGALVVLAALGALGVFLYRRLRGSGPCGAAMKTADGRTVYCPPGFSTAAKGAEPVASIAGCDSKSGLCNKCVCSSAWRKPDDPLYAKCDACAAWQPRPTTYQGGGQVAEPLTECPCKK